MSNGRLVLSIDRFVEGLCELPGSRLSHPQVKGYVEEHLVDPDTLRRYLHYRNTHYTRNLIYRCERFEIMTICWDVGQRSAIHNHHNQNCWMAVPIGRLAVENYRVVSEDPATRRCRLELLDELIMDPEHAGSVDPANPVHAVINRPGFGQPATSIHIYSLPYESCVVYSLETGTFQEVPLHYTSEYGVLLEEERPS